MFTLNGKQYPDIELSFNDVCNLQEKGIDISAMGPKNVLPVVRGIVSLRFGGNLEIAGNEIQAHLANGGSVEDLVKIVTDSVENSGFFRALNKKA